MNLGNPEEYRIADLAKEVIAATGSASQLVQMPLPQDDPRRRMPDISLAKAKLGWEPKVLLREGLRRTVADFARRLGKNIPQ
jgi:UDP-glucuronate decarboxylase